MRYPKIKIISVIIFLYFAAPSASHAAYDFFVDKNSAQETEDGSETFPFKTVGAALTHIQSANLENKIVFVKAGTYAESIILTRNAQLIGESKENTIIDADGRSNAVNLASSKSELKNLTVKNAEATNIIIDKRSKATITNCKIESAGKFGVDVKQSSASKKYQFTFKNSEVSGSGSQGLYISKRKFNVSDSEVFSNGEEGIDLHQGNKGTVSGNDIHGNGESGIESILSGASLTFKNNEVENNHTQGIAVQVYSTSKKGEIKITGNTIKSNHAHGVRFANYTRSIGPKKFKEFVDKYVKLSKNHISGNGEEEIYYQ